MFYGRSKRRTLSNSPALPTEMTLLVKQNLKSRDVSTAQTCFQPPLKLRLNLISITRLSLCRTVGFTIYKQLVYHIIYSHFFPCVFSKC